MRNWLVFAVLNFLFASVLSQNETVNWVFGNQAALSFSTGSPLTVVGSAFNNSGAPACQSGTAGNLLFYSDGVSVWNSANLIMANGAGLNGAGNPMAVRMPGNSNLHYLFYPGQGNTFQYSIIDMNLAAGMGSVTVKNQTLTTGTALAVTGNFHCNGTDAWVVTYQPASGNFLSYLVSSSGITSPVISPAGYSLTTYNIKMSPSGTKLAASMQNSNSAFLMLHNFNRTTGSVSTGTTLYTNGVAITDSEFSADGSKLYTAVPLAGVIQMNLCAGTTTAIINSAYTIPVSQLWGLERAADGKIYGAIWGSNALACINTPSGSGVACNFSLAAVPLMPATTYGSLPNLFSGYLNLSKAGIYYNVNIALSCKTASFTMPAFGCMGVGNFTAAYWNFGEPASGSNNTSNLFNPSHVYNAAGTYTVKFSGQQVCADTFYQVVKIIMPTVTINGPASICPGNNATLTANGAANYIWNGIYPSTTLVTSPTVNTIYTVTASSANLDCSSTATHTIIMNPGITLSALSVTVCEGASFSVSATGATTYSWSTGVFTNTMLASPPSNTIYVVSGQTGSCVSTAYVQVSVQINPTVTVGAAKTAVCPGDSTTLIASGAQTFSWSTSVSGPTITVKPSGVTVYSVTGYNNGCGDTATVSVKVLPSPSIFLVSSDSIVCKNSSVIIGATGAISYSLNSVVFQNTTSIVPVANGIYTVNGIDTNACVGSQTIAVLVRQDPLISVTPSKLLICRGDSLSLKGHGAQSYLWDNGLNADSIYIKPDENRTYAVTGIDQFNCSGTATINVNVSLCSGIKDVENVVEKYTVAPNPTHNIFAVYFSEEKSVEIFIYDITGRIVHSELSYLTGRQITLDDECKGLFVVRITNNGKHTFFKIVMQ